MRTPGVPADDTSDQRCIISNISIVNRHTCYISKVSMRTPGEPADGTSDQSCIISNSIV